jgi:hypothetical protein
MLAASIISELRRTVSILDFRRGAVMQKFLQPESEDGLQDGWDYHQERARGGESMTYSIKLSRRLARFRAAVPVAVALVTLASCSDNPSGPAADGTTGPPDAMILPDSASVASDGSVQYTPSDSTLSLSRNGNGRGQSKNAVATLTVMPDSATMKTGATNRFSAVGTLNDGSTVDVTVKWAATGGTIDQTGLYTAGGQPGKYSVTATANSGVTDTSTVNVVNIAPALTQLTLSPASASVTAGTTKQFSATGKAQDGTTVAVAPIFTATGGSITPSGLYTAGTTAGTFRVIATDSATHLADTSAVTVTASTTTVQAVVLSPSTASVTAGGTQQFTASATASDGSTVPISATYSATGGTITGAGLYTAGQTAGTYRAIATDPGSGRADTASITVTAVVASGSCPASGYLRLVNVSTTSQLLSAVGGAQPGDQIQMATGTYVTNLLKITRSGTAANRITLCGPRTAIINGAISPDPASYWAFRGFRIRGDSPNSQIWGVYQHAGGHNIYDNLEVDHQAQEGIVLHDGPSYGNVVSNNYIHDTGRGSPQYGECIYIGNGTTQDQIVDSTWIHHNRIVNCTTEGIEIKSGTRYHLIEFNTITNAGTARLVGSDAPIQVRGNNTRVNDNTVTNSARYLIELYADRAGWASNNAFRRNTLSGAGNGKAFYVGGSGNVVYCSNVAVSPTALGVSCAP